MCRFKFNSACSTPEKNKMQSIMTIFNLTTPIKYFSLMSLILFTSNHNQRNKNVDTLKIISLFSLF